MTRAPGLTRRQALALAPAALGLSTGLVACTDDGEPTPAPASPSPTPVDPDVALRAAATAREQALVREYDAVLARLPELSARLLPLRDHHREHLAALAGDEPPADEAAADEAAADEPTADEPAPGSAPSPSAGSGVTSPDPAPSGAPDVPAPADAATALRRLVAAERAAGQAHAAHCLVASRGLAGVLGALSASELSHEVALT